MEKPQPIAEIVVTQGKEETELLITCSTGAANNFVQVECAEFGELKPRSVFKRAWSLYVSDLYVPADIVAYIRSYSHGVVG